MKKLYIISLLSFLFCLPYTSSFAISGDASLQMNQATKINSKAALKKSLKALKAQKKKEARKGLKERLGTISLIAAWASYASLGLLAISSSAGVLSFLILLAISGRAGKAYIEENGRDPEDIESKRASTGIILSLVALFSAVLVGTIWLYNLMFALS